MSFLTENTGAPVLNILVLEPYDITWLGIQQMLRTTLGDRVSLIRITETDQLSESVQCHRVDAVLLSAISHRTEVLPLLQQLALLMRCNTKVHIGAYLRKDLPHLVDLLLAFGVNTVFKGLIDEADLAHYLVPNNVACHPVRLTNQECNVAQALLAGKSVSRVAQLMHKDIRTISAHKQALLGKLNMVSRGELQVLGGRLMADEVRL
ncbi:MAG: helix-turn-helix transcriptional regulator [Serratia sp. (in: enterobacteria)]|uniref:helix-turn-helix transcriptional regulator n=1 Tax=Serratia sp. (in: enterobacteria) TaxID=616 RepID=UPI003F3E930E